MKIQYRSLFVVLAAFLLCGSPGEAQDANPDWTKWPQEAVKHPDGTKYTSPGGNAEIIIHKVTALEAAAGQKMTKFGSSVKEQLLYALSIASIDVDEEKSFIKHQLDCTAFTADGARNVVAGVAGQGKQRVVVIVLKAPTDEFENEDANQKRSRLLKSKKNSTTKTSKRPKQTAAKPDGASNKYPLPRNAEADPGKSYDGWTKIDKFTWFAKPGDANSPRRLIFETKAGKFKTVPDLIAAAIAAKGIKNFKLVKGIDLPVYRQVMDRYRYSAIGTSEQNGKKAIVTMSVDRMKREAGVWVYIVEVQEDTWRQWGGMTSVLYGGGFIDSMDQIPADRRAQIAASSLEGQLMLFAETDNKVAAAAAQISIQANFGVLMRMQELNYDLLLGGDITSPFVSD